jgi:hypothetical protein
VNGKRITVTQGLRGWYAAVKHLVDDGKISSYSERPPDVYYIKATVHAAPMPINEAMGTIG